MKKDSSSHPISVARTLRSLGHAVRGIGDLFATQPNALLHLAIAIAVVTLGAFLDLPPLEWAIVVICIAVVLAAEAFNTAVEFLADVVEPNDNPMIGKAKDVAAGAVLLTSLGAAAAGLFIFVPHIVRAMSGT